MTLANEQIAHSALVGGAETALHSHAGGGTQPDIPVTRQSPTVSQTIAAGYSGIVVENYEIAGGTFLELAANSVLEIS